MSKYTDAKTQISIKSFSSKGFGKGTFQKHEGTSVSQIEVPFTVPGDFVSVEIRNKKRGTYFGQLAQVIDPSQDRTLSRCIHADSCGGCVWQQVSYDRQLKEKESLVETLFRPLVHSETMIHPIVPAGSLWEYRNKMEYSFSQNKNGDRFLGLVMAGTKGHVQTLKQCHLTASWFIDVLQSTFSWWEKSSLMAYHPAKDTGSLRTLTIREGKKTRHKMVMLTVSGNPAFSLGRMQLESFVHAVKQALPDSSVSIVLRIHQAIAGTPTQFYEMVLSGADYLEEQVQIQVGSYQRMYEFKISPTAFFQPNSLQAELLYSRALEICGMDTKELVWDLYAGTATLGQVFAPFAKKVVAIEINPYAVFDARMNVEKNQIQNLSVYCGDVAAVLKQLFPNKTGPDLVIVDPPRSGLNDDAISLILSHHPKEILYISCKPESQARDCAVLTAQGYQIVHIQSVDQFPHTVHVENVVLLRRVPC